MYTSVLSDPSPSPTLTSWATLTLSNCRHPQTPACLPAFLSSPGDPEEASCITSEVAEYFESPELYLLELSRGPDFLFFKLVEAAVQQVEGILTQFRAELLELEEQAFTQVGMWGRLWSYVM